jgi:hypothetical protein
MGGSKVGHLKHAPEEGTGNLALSPLSLLLSHNQGNSLLSTTCSLSNVASQWPKQQGQLIMDGNLQNCN